MPTAKKIETLMKESIEDRKNIHKIMNKQFKINTKEHVDIKNLLLSMNSIKLNGNDERFTLEESLRILYAATTELRAKKNLREAFEVWKTDTVLGRLFSKKSGKWIIGLLIFCTLFPLLHSLGFITISNPVELVTTLIRWYKGS
ncbi:MAG: hypothetical protein WC979_07900 [Candidatus Pacearchaeota archaeon]|jgi:hypothetical protein